MQGLEVPPDVAWRERARVGDLGAKNEQDSAAPGRRDGLNPGDRHGVGQALPRRSAFRVFHASKQRIEAEAEVELVRSREEIGRDLCTGIMLRERPDEDGPVVPESRA